VLGVQSGAGVVQAAGRGAGQAQGVVEFTVGEESGVTGDGRAAELQLDVTVEVNAQGVLLAVTHWVPRSFRQEVVRNAGCFREMAQTPCRNDRAIWEIRDYCFEMLAATILSTRLIPGTRSRSVTIADTDAAVPSK